MGNDNAGTCIFRGEYYHVHSVWDPYADRIPGDEVQLIWQSGAYYEATVKAALAGKNYPHVVQMPFIARMDMAYKAADLVISRAGAGSISELCLLGKAAILVPSPNVAEDHQTKNAMALSEKGAALLIPDREAESRLIDTAIENVQNEALLAKMQERILQLAQRDSAARIADIILGIVAERNSK